MKRSLRYQIVTISLFALAVIPVSKFSYASLLQASSTPYLNPTPEPCGSNDRINHAVFSPDGKLALATWSIGQVRLWDLQTGRELLTLQWDSNYHFYHVAFSPDGKFILTGAETEALLWDAKTGALLHSFAHSTHNSDGTWIQFSLDGRSILTSSGNDSKLWETASGNLIQTFPGNLDLSYSEIPQLSSDGNYVMTYGYDQREWNLWNARTANKVHTFPSTFRAEISLDSKTILTSSDQGLILWDAATFDKLFAFNSVVDASYSWEFSHDGRYLITSQSPTTDSQGYRLWDLQTLTQQPLPKSKDQYPGYAIFPDNQHLFIIDKLAEQTVWRIWDIRTGKDVKSFPVDENLLTETAFAISPDGKYALVGTEQGRLRVWDLQLGQLSRTLC